MPESISRRTILTGMMATAATAAIAPVIGIDTAAGAAVTIAPLPIAPLRVPQSNLGLVQQPDDKLQWLRDTKLGMFIHWGVYSGPAQGEWYMQNSAVTPANYRKFYTDASDQQFTADAYKPADWVTLAKNLGARYTVLTTRHHEGFALWPTGSPNAFNSGQPPLSHDYVKDYVAAVRAGGLRVGLYYSPINWQYPGYFDVTGTNCATNVWGYTTDPAHKENARVMKNEVYQSVKELVTDYGAIDDIWWDGGWLAETGTDADGAFFWEPGQYRDPANAWLVDAAHGETETGTGKPLGLMGMVRKHQPNVVVTPRAGWVGDHAVEEGPSIPAGAIRSGGLTQKIFTVGGAWGYDPSGATMSYGTAVSLLVNSYIRDMCVLLNVGPDRHGTVPAVQATLLAQLGTFMTANGAAIYSTRGGPWNPVDNQYGFTYTGSTIYVHLLPGYSGTSFTTPSLGDAQVTAVKDAVSNTALSYTFSNAKATITGINRTRYPDDSIVAIVLDRTVLPADVAQGKTATADSEETSHGNLAALAVDGSTATRWCAADRNTGHWLKVDLGSVKTLTGSRIAWEMPGAQYRYRIEGSSNNSTWTTLADLTGTTSTDQVQTASFSAQARYVRVTVTGLATGNYASIWSLQLFDRPFSTSLAIPST